MNASNYSSQPNYFERLKHPCSREREKALKSYYRLNALLMVENQNFDEFAMLLKDTNIKNRIHSMRILW
jgi:hypothetical protein